MADITTVRAKIQAALDEANAVPVVVEPPPPPPPPPPSDGLPAWVPQPGFYADIPTTNTPSQAIAAEVPYYSAFADGIFSNWSGAFYTEDYSALGALVYEGGGHSSNPTGFSAAEHDGKMLLDLTTLTWTTRNWATKYYTESGTADEYGQHDDGSVFSPHTYHGCQNFPRAWGGGPLGGSFRAGFPGGAQYNTAWVTDLSQALLGWRKLVPIITVASGTFAVKSAYLETAIDTQRQGWWVATHMASDRICFVHPDGVVDTYMGAGINSTGTCFTRDPTRDKLVRIDVTDVTAPLRIYELDCTNPGSGWKAKSLIPDPATIPDRTALPVYMVNPNDKVTMRNYFSQCGLEWSSILGAFVQFEDAKPQVWVIKYDPATDTYAVRLEAVAAAPGTGIPSYAVGTSGATLHNGTFNKFREVPALRCFIWATSGTQKPQAFRLMGM